MRRVSGHELVAFPQQRPDKTLIEKKMWSFNELDHDSKHNVDVEFSAHDAFLQ